MAVKRRSFKKNTRSGLKKKSRIYRKKSFSKKSRKNNKKSKKSKLRKRNRSRRFNKMIGGANSTNLDGTYKLKDDKDNIGIFDNINAFKLFIKKDDTFTLSTKDNNTFISIAGQEEEQINYKCNKDNSEKNCVYFHETKAIDTESLKKELKLLSPYEQPNNNQDTSIEDFINEYCNKEVKLKDLKENEHILIDKDKIKNLKLTKIGYTDKDKNKSFLPFANDESTLKITKTDCCYTLENPINLASKIQNITPSQDHILACIIYGQEIKMTLKELIDILNIVHKDIILGPNIQATKTGNFKSNATFTITEPEPESESFKIENGSTIVIMRNSNDIFTLTNENSEYQDNIKPDAKIFKINDKEDKEDKLSLIELRIKHLQPVQTESN